MFNTYVHLPQATFWQIWQLNIVEHLESINDFPRKPLYNRLFQGQVWFPKGTEFRCQVFQGQLPGLSHGIRHLGNDVPRRHCPKECGYNNVINHPLSWANIQKVSRWWLGDGKNDIVILILLQTFRHRNTTVKMEIYLILRHTPRWTSITRRNLPQWKAPTDRLFSALHWY